MHPQLRGSKRFYKDIEPIKKELENKIEEFISTVSGKGSKKTKEQLGEGE